MSKATEATHAIPAGGELFKDYGESWFITRTSSLGLIPLYNDYTNAEKMMNKLHTMFERRQIPEAARQDLWDLVHDLPWVKTRAMNAIPRGYENLELVAQQGIRAAYQPQASRDLTDLQAHGRCMDHMRAGPSTLEQAGRGAFATRRLPKDTIITGTPLLFFPSHEYFDMYAGDWFHKTFIDESAHAGFQLLLNYCWHHNASSIYLCPYGGGINYINHNQTRANVRLQWARDGEMGHNATLLHQSPTSMYHRAAPPLHMDVVALRDIESGEELMMDYGNDWENAWLAHVKTWPAAADDTMNTLSSVYVSPRDWNRENRWAMLRTQQEQLQDPYPPNFHLYCLSDISDWEDNHATESSDTDSLWTSTTVGYPCRIVQRSEQEEGVYRYKVEYNMDATVHDDDRNSNDHEEDEAWHLSDWIGREAMRFEDVPYTTDMFVGQAFRHPIGMSEEIFPLAWRGAFLAPLSPEFGSELE